MHALLDRLRQLSDDELLAISEAVDTELECRMERTDPMPESARRRAVMRQQSYRRTTGSHAPPVYTTGLGKNRRGRIAA
jgi:hypothetical protein